MLENSDRTKNLVYFIINRRIIYATVLLLLLARNASPSYRVNIRVETKRTWLSARFMCGC